ncbi:MAG TPA: NifU family protein [Gemmatimonadales bacterium]
MAAPESFTAVPDHDRIRRFVVEGDEPLTPGGPLHFSSADQAAGVPVAEAVLSVAGVQEIVLEGNAVTALRRADANWDDLQERVRYAIGTAVRPDGDGPDPGAALNDDGMFEAVDRIVARDINPAIASHGGSVELIDVQDGTVVLRMMGGCQGCGMANVTLRQGIEAQLRRLIPGLKGLRDITDHASGANPYFT